jgi:hypothetical protein
MYSMDCDPNAPLETQDDTYVGRGPSAILPHLDPTNDAHCPFSFQAAIANSHSSQGALATLNPVQLNLMDQPISGDSLGHT